MSREALVLLVCCCDFRDGAERLISSKSLRNAVIRAFPGLFRILRMCAPRRAAAVVRPREREKSADRRRRILISRLLIIRASVPRRKSPFPAYFKGFPAVSLLIPPYPAFLKYPVSPQARSVAAKASDVNKEQIKMKEIAEVNTRLRILFSYRLYDFDDFIISLNAHYIAFNIARSPCHKINSIVCHDIVHCTVVFVLFRIIGILFI